MQFFEEQRDKRGAGHWDGTTNRYIPLTGGLRSQIPIQDDPEIPRYFGLVGIDEGLTPSAGTLAALMGLYSGGMYIPEGAEGEFIRLILDQAHHAASRHHEEGGE